MYVRRWPRISASSRTPPSEMRMNSRPSERAIDLPSDVLPTPGGPGEAEDRPLLPRRELAHGQVLEDALLHLLEVVVIGVEDLARLIEVEPVLGPLATTAARPATRGRCAARCTRPTTAPSASGARAACAPSSRRRPASRAALIFSSNASRSLGVLALAELVLDRLQLLAQHRLALVLRELLAHLRVDLLLDLDQLDFALQQDQQAPQPLRDVALDQQRRALLGRQVDGRGDDVAEPRRDPCAGPAPARSRPGCRARSRSAAWRRRRPPCRARRSRSGPCGSRPAARRWRPGTASPARSR